MNKIRHTLTEEKHNMRKRQYYGKKHILMQLSKQEYSQFMSATKDNYIMGLYKLNFIQNTNCEDPH